MVCVPGIRDTQAGLKGFRRAAAVELARRVRLDRFSFDVELLFIARRMRLRIVDSPVLFVYCKEPSTVHFVRDSLAMARDMLRIRWRGWRGVYEQPLSAGELADVRDGGSLAAIATPAVAAVGRAAAVRSDRVG